MNVNIIIPTYNRKEYLFKTLQSLNNQTYKNFEVIIIDDASDIDIRKEINELNLLYKYNYIHLNKKKGRAGARNTGISISKGNILLFFDDHSLAMPNLIEKHVKKHLQFENYGALRGRIEFIKDLEFSVKYKPPRFWSNLHHIIYANSPIVHFGTHNLSVKKEVVDKVGGFDENFTLYGAEDQEFGIRIKKAGYKIGYISQALAYNIIISKTNEELLQRAIESGKMAALLAKKHPEYKKVLGINIINKILYQNKKNYKLYKKFIDTKSKINIDDEFINSKLLKVLYYYSFLENIIN